MNLNALHKEYPNFMSHLPPGEAQKIAAYPDGRPCEACNQWSNYWDIDDAVWQQLPVEHRTKHLCTKCFRDLRHLPVTESHMFRKLPPEAIAVITKIEDNLKTINKMTQPIRTLARLPDPFIDGTKLVVRAMSADFYDKRGYKGQGNMGVLNGQPQINLRIPLTDPSTIYHEFVHAYDPKVRLKLSPSKTTAQGWQDNTTPHELDAAVSGGLRTAQRMLARLDAPARRQELTTAVNWLRNPPNDFEPWDVPPLLCHIVPLPYLRSKPNLWRQFIQRFYNAIIQQEATITHQRLLLAEGRHKYGCVLAVLPQQLARRLRNFGKSIPAEILDKEEGLEDRQHITCKYGLHTSDVEEVREALRGFGPFTVKLGKMSIFSNGKHDVLKVDVIGRRLHDLNKLIRRRLQCTDTYRTFIPHVTIAYLKPGRAASFDGLTTFEGTRIRISEVVFSTKSKKETIIQL